LKDSSHDETPSNDGLTFWRKCTSQKLMIPSTIAMGIWPKKTNLARGISAVCVVDSVI